MYLGNTEYINNWDLVDLTAPSIVGEYLSEKNKDILYDFAGSRSLWERRIAILSTFHFTRNKKYDDTINIAGKLLYDKEDLMHKAVGWMLREVGKRNMAVEERFLKKYYRVMPRTMLRYAIERFPEARRRAYLKSKV